MAGVNCSGHKRVPNMPVKEATATAGQFRALWLSTIAFTVCFAVWTIFAIIGMQIKEEPRTQRDRSSAFWSARPS